MEEFKNQINEIASFAKARGFNPATQFDALIKAWIKMTYERSIWIQNHHQETMDQVKEIIG